MALRTVTDDRSPLRLLFSGDAMLGRGVNRTIQQKGPAYPLDPVADITRAADLFFTNLECAISPHDRRFSGAEKTFYFRAETPAAETLTHAGVDVVSLANNHALDADYDGLRATRRILDEHDIAHAGAGPTLESARRPAQLNADSLRLGVLSCCDHQRDFAARPHRPGIWYVDPDDDAAIRELQEAVEQLADRVDHVIVAYHWQPNWVPEIEPLYRRLARILIDAGATIIWGHSPHHFQGVEWIAESIVLYSTGGLVDDYAVDDYYRNDRQLLFEATCTERSVEEVRAYPIELDYAHTHPAPAEARDWIVNRFSELCASVGSAVGDDGEWLHVNREN